MFFRSAIAPPFALEIKPCGVIPLHSLDQWCQRLVTVDILGIAVLVRISWVIVTAAFACEAPVFGLRSVWTCFVLLYQCLGLRRAQFLH